MVSRDAPRRLRALVAELEALTLTISDASPSSRHRENRKPPQQQRGDCESGRCVDGLAGTC